MRPPVHEEPASGFGWRYCRLILGVAARGQSSDPSTSSVSSPEMTRRRRRTPAS